MKDVLLENETLTEVNENIKLIQKKNGLTFGTDAFLLASFIKQQKKAVAVELGGGTGIISLLCASKEKLGKTYCSGCLHIIDDDDMGLVNGSKDDPDSLIG